MYEMYPDAWPAAPDRRSANAPADPPQRRARKQHSVLPAVLAQSKPVDQHRIQTE
jgi:hypothetical protein